MLLLYYQRCKPESEAQRAKPKGSLESQIRIAMLFEPSAVLCVCYETRKSRKRCDVMFITIFAGD